MRAQPNRPDHPDVQVLVDHLKTVDRLAAESSDVDDIMARYADPRCLDYVSMQRARMFLRTLPPQVAEALAPRMTSALASFWQEGFVVAHMFQATKAGTPMSVPDFPDLP